MADRGIVVVGSSNMDLVVRVPRFPELGETLTGTDFRTVPGGKAPTRPSRPRASGET